MKIVALSIYPLKAARRLDVDAVIVGERGFEHDRRWMLVDADGKFVSQRKYPDLATLGVTVPDGGLRLEHQGESLVVRTPRESIKVEVWGDLVEAFDAGDAASAWLSEHFGTRLNLVWMGPQSTRALQDFEAEVSFADGYPYLLTSLASLAAVQDAVEDETGMERFRPNIVIDGDAAFEEHQWSVIRIGDVEFDVAKPCARCVVTTVDQDTGVKVRTGEPLATLARINKIDGAACFGENLVARSTGGTLRVGDEVEVLQRR